MFMFVLDSTPKFEIVNFLCGPSSGTNKNLHTHRLRSSVRGISARASSYIFIQFYQVNIWDFSALIIHFFGGRYFWVEILDRELKHNSSMLRIPNVSVYFLWLV